MNKSIARSFGLQGSICPWLSAASLTFAGIEHHDTCSDLLNVCARRFIAARFRFHYFCASKSLVSLYFTSNVP